MRIRPGLWGSERSPHTHTHTCTPLPPAGNIELHLIKGPPVVPQGDHLIVGHLSLEIDAKDIDEACRRLKAAKVPFRKNVR